MARCLEIVKRCQHLDAKLPYGFNWTRQMARRWESDTPYDGVSPGVALRPAGDPTGFQYRSSGGQSGAFEPIWPTILGGQVTDGSITWTAEAYSGDSLLHGIASDIWSASVPAGLTVVAQPPVVTAGLQQTAVVLSGGAAGVTYGIENEVVTDLGHEYVARVVLQVV